VLAAVLPSFLGDYAGVFTVDGYEAYTQNSRHLSRVYAHARRKYDETKKSQPKGKFRKADMAMNLIAETDIA